MVQSVTINSEEVDLPDTPTGDIGFAIKSPDTYFAPMYYPERLNITTKKELEKVPAACEGQKISISKLKNSTIHLTGKCHTGELKEIDQLSHTTEAVEVITPVIEGNGMEAIVKSAERGEILGWDGFAEEWLFSYTLDLKSTGKDEYDHEAGSRFRDYETTPNDGVIYD